MVTRNTTRNALRASLKNEDAALTERLPAPTKPAARTRKAAPAKAGTAAKPPAPKPRAPANSQAQAAAKRPAPAKPAAPRTPPAQRATAPKTTPPKTIAKPAAAARKPAAAAAAASTTPQASAVDVAVEKIRSTAKNNKKVKIERDSFSMPETEHKRIRKLRETLEKAGRSATKSEMLRAGLALLASRSPAEIIVLLDALPKVSKGKRSKKR